MFQKLKRSNVFIKFSALGVIKNKGVFVTEKKIIRKFLSLILCKLWLCLIVVRDRVQFTTNLLRIWKWWITVVRHRLSYFLRIFFLSKIKRITTSFFVLFCYDSHQISMWRCHTTIRLCRCGRLNAPLI